MLISIDMLASYHYNAIINNVTTTQQLKGVKHDNIKLQQQTITITKRSIYR